MSLPISPPTVKFLLERVPVPATGSPGRKQGILLHKLNPPKLEDYSVSTFNNIVNSFSLSIVFVFSLFLVKLRFW